MKRNLHGGLFIVFEGLDGSGQSTQAKLLEEYFKWLRVPTLLTKEPTQWTMAGKEIEKVLDEKIVIEPLKFQKLFARDRAQHLKDEIIPALKQGKMVICDRYAFSSMAYGGLDTSISKLVILNSKFICPNRVFFLKVSPVECLRRIEDRGEGIKFFEKSEKLKKVAANYECVAKRFGLVFNVIDGERRIEEIHHEIVSNLKTFFYGRGIGLL
ncbi:MAG: dTMP kinase [Patescibacteria group bacterium]